MNMFPKPIALTLALGIALAGNAGAQSTMTPAQQKELDAARADLEKASQRYAELMGKSGGALAPIRIERREIRRPVIGVLLAGDDKPGVRIVGVTPDSAAAGAGLKGGDRIIRVNDKAIDAADGEARVAQARAMLAMSTDTKTPVNLAYERDGKTASATMTAKDGDRFFVISGPGNGTTAQGDVRLFTNKDGEVDMVQAKRISIHTAEAKAQANAAAMMVAPEVRRELTLIDSDCKGSDCKLPALVEALRWSGVNLATVDAGLGRYFGTDRGVLVLGTGKDLDGLQAGDVIRAIGGKPVNTPREAMDALRAQPADSKVAVDYLRDRKEASVQVAVPKALPFQVRMDPKAMRSVEKRRYVMKGKDGKTLTWEGGPNDTPPSWVKDANKDGQGIERRKTVIVRDSLDGAPSAPPKVD